MVSLVTINQRAVLYKSLTDFNEYERCHILSIMEKDEIVQVRHQLYIMRLRSELQTARHKGALKSTSSDSRACARCRAELGRIIDRGAFCRWCRHRVCKSCREYLSNETSDWLCTVCHKQMELTAATGDWMSQFVRCSGKAVQRSWTFSDTTSSPWAALRNSPEMRAYSSMPRHQDCDFVARMTFCNQLTQDKIDPNENNEPVQAADEQSLDVKNEHTTAAENKIETIDNSSLDKSEVLNVENIIPSTETIVDENIASVQMTDNESNIESPPIETRRLSESISYGSSLVSAEDRPLVNKRAVNDTILEPLTGTVFRKMTLKKRRVDTRNLPPGVTPPRSRRNLVSRTQDDLDFPRDRDDYKLVFISSSDSSSREELQSDDGDGSSTCSGLVAGGDCEWDYFEPGGGGGEAASVVAAAPQSVGVPVPIPVPVPVPIPVFVPVPWTPDLTIRIQHLWSMQQLITVTLDGQMSQRLDVLAVPGQHASDSKGDQCDKTSAINDSEVIVNSADKDLSIVDNGSILRSESLSENIEHYSSVLSKPTTRNDLEENGVVLKNYKSFTSRDYGDNVVTDSIEQGEECSQDSMEEDDDESSSVDDSDSEKPSKRIYKLNDEEESLEERSDDEDSSGEFSMASSLSSSPGSGKFKRVYVVNDSDSDLGELPEYNDDSEGEVTLLRHVTMDEVRLSSILQDSLEVEQESRLPNEDTTAGDKLDSHIVVEILPDSAENVSHELYSTESKFHTEQFLKKEIEFCYKGVSVTSSKFDLPKPSPGEVEGSDEECGKLGETRGSNTSDEFSGTESMELEQGQIRPVVPVSVAGESWRETGRFTSLVMITQDHLEPVNVVTSDTTTLVPSLDSEVQVVTGNGATAAVILEEGLPDDDSWVEDLDRDDLVTTTEESSEDDNCYVDREEELRGYHPRSAIDFTLHTIVEESCEESEVEGDKNRRTELEKYFFYGVGDGSSEFKEIDTMSETSSIHSEGLESLGGFDDGAQEDKDPADLASSRLENYFLSGLLGCSRRDSDGSVGSDSEGKPSPEQRRKRLVRARGTGRQHSNSQDNLNESEQQDELQVESEGSSTETDSHDDLSNSFEKSDGQFDTVKRTKKKKRSVVAAPSLELLEVSEETSGAPGSKDELDTEDGHKTPQPEIFNPADLSCSRNKHQSRDSGFMGSSDDLLKENKDIPITEVVRVAEEEVQHVPETKNIEKTVIPQVKVSPQTDLIRKDSFNNWSSDEETNLMMSKMRQFFKTMVASQPKVSSPAAGSRSKPPQLVHFESELTRLMKTVPGIRDEQVKEIVEYLSSEDTWSDSYDSSDYTSSDLEGGNKKSALQEEISASCRQIISNFETVEESASSDAGDGLNKDTAFVYQRLVASFNKLDKPASDSPPLIAKVMQHIGSRLVALMHEVSSADGGSPKAARYHKRLQPKLSTTSTTEDEEDSIEDYIPLPRSKSHDPLIEENRQEASDNERFSWRGSFESALMASDSRTRLASGGEGSVSASALALAAKRRSAGDLLFKTSSREQLDRVRSCGSIGGSVEDKIWGMRHQKRRRSSVPDSGGSNDGDDDSDEEVDNGKSTTLPRSLQSSCTTTNSLPRLPTTPASPSIYKAHSVSVVSARYRPPGYGSRGTAIAPRRRSAQTPSPLPALAGDDASVCSESVSLRAVEDDDRIHTIRTSSLGARSDSLASVYSGAGEGRYGSVAVRGEVEFGLQYNYRQGALEIYVKQCRDLAAVDTKRNRSDPYVKVYLLPDKSKSGKRKTRVKKHTLNPIFEETLKFYISLEGLESRTLWLSVWHSDMFGRNDFLGEVTLPLQNKVFDDPLPKFYSLQERTEPLEELLSSKGELIVGLKFVPPESNPGKKSSNKGCLQVLVKEAKNLAAVKSNGTSDPFCKSYLLPDKGRSSKQKTLVVRKCVSPAWNHTFKYNGVTLDELSSRSLELTIWDHDRLASNEFLGGVRLNTGSGKHNGKPVDWMDASGKENTLWQRMLERPNLWVESCLSLRPSLDLRNNS